LYPLFLCPFTSSLMFSFIITFNPSNIYTLTFKLTLNLPFKASSFPSMFRDNASPTLPLVASPYLTSCKSCLKYILCCVFVYYHLNPCHPSTFTLMFILYQHFKAPSPISVQECCLTHPALGRPLFPCRVASLSFCLISPLLL
jgi:hypothetical protein